MRKYIGLFLVILIIFFAFSIFHTKSPRVGLVSLNNKTFSVEIADTNSLRDKGLSGHKPLSDTQGMFFVFQESAIYGFWMKDMTFPIDIIWFDEDFAVITIERSVSPETYPKIFYPSVPSRYVLEVSAGQSDAIALKIGDHMAIVESTNK